MIRTIIEIILDLPKTLYFNFYYFPIKEALKFPLRVSRYVNIINMGNHKSVKLKKIQRGIVKLGVSRGSFSLSEYSKCWWNIAPEGEIIFNGKANLARGFQLEISNKGKIDIGDNFFCNTNMILSADCDICIGNDFLSGWNCTIIDGDGHKILDGNKKHINPSKQIIIGEHVWMAANSSILKGTTIPNNTIIGYGAIASGEFTEKGTILAGNPVKIVKKNTYWLHDRV